MPLESTTISGPSAAGAAPAAETPVTTQPTITFDPMLSYLDGGDLLMKQLTTEAAAATLETEPAAPEPAPETDLPVEPEVPETEEPTAEPEALPPAIAAMQKRIDKITAQKAEAAAKLEEATKEAETAKAELERLRQLPPPQAPTPQQPLAHIQTPEDLERVEQAAEEFRAWGFRHLNGGTRTNEKGEEIYLSAEDVGDKLATIDVFLRKAIPQRREYFQARAHYETQAAEEFPFLKDPQSEGSKLVQQFLGSVPYTHPDARAVAATWAEGELARRARQAKAKAPAPTPIEKPKPAPAKTVAPTPPLGSSGAPGLRTVPATQQAASAADALAELARHSNDPDALIRYMQAVGKAA